MARSNQRNRIRRAAAQSRVKTIAIDPANDSKSNRIMHKVLLTLMFLAAATLIWGAIVTNVHAQNAALTDAPDAPPPLTAADLERSLNSDNSQATANKRSTTTEGVVTEFRDGNRTYLIQVNPQTGARYYVNDADGNGSPESYRDNTESDVNIGKWKITSW